MISAEARTSAKPAMATRDDLLRLAGDVDERKVVHRRRPQPIAPLVRFRRQWGAAPEYRVPPRAAIR